MKKPPTDLQFLETIYDMYYETFVNYREEPPSRSAKNYVPIDIHAIARRFAIDSELVFGRLYYDLNPRYGYDVPSAIPGQAAARVEFFGMRVGGDRHVIHFPYLSGVVAKLRSDYRQYVIPTVVSAISAAVSFVSAAVAVAALMLGVS